jgi:hypothetical protein
MAGLKANTKMLTGIALDPTKEFAVHLGHASGSLEKPLAGGVLADRFEQFANEFLNSRLVDHSYTSPT